MKIFLIVSLTLTFTTITTVYAHSPEHSMADGIPPGIFSSLIIWGSILIVTIVLILSIKYLLKPGEKNPDHIKNIVKNEGL